MTPLRSLHRLALALPAVIALSAGPAGTQADWSFAVSQGLTRERVVGLLDLPELVGGGCGTPDRKTIDAYSTPSASGPLVGRIEYVVAGRQPDGAACDSAQLVVRVAAGGVEELPSDESDYEVRAAVVYERQGDWFRIALQRRSAWVQRPNSEPAFHPYPDLLTDRLAYIMAGWDGRLWSEPGGSGKPVSLAPGWRRHVADEVPIELVSVRRVGGEVWIQVRLETERCGEPISDVKSVTGWMTAHRTQGRPAAWFFSRGC